MRTEWTEWGVSRCSWVAACRLQSTAWLIGSADKKGHVISAVNCPAPTYTLLFLLCLSHVPQYIKQGNVLPGTKIWYPNWSDSPLPNEVFRKKCKHHFTRIVGTNSTTYYVWSTLFFYFIFILIVTLMVTDNFTLYLIQFHGLYVIIAIYRYF